MLEAAAVCVAGAGVERAKLLWAQDKPHRAIVALHEVTGRQPRGLHELGGGQKKSRVELSSKLWTHCKSGVLLNVAGNLSFNATSAQSKRTLTCISVQLAFLQ